MISDIQLIDQFFIAIILETTFFALFKHQAQGFNLSFRAFKQSQTRSYHFTCRAISASLYLACNKLVKVDPKVSVD